MDNLTHTLAGAALAGAGLRRRTALGAATLMIGANFPDIDAAAVFFGSVQLEVRRGWTHGVLAMVVLPFVLTGIIWAWQRWVRGGRVGEGDPPFDPRQVLLLAAIGILSHPALDWLNTYGVRLLMPFSREWFRGDALFIVDPWVILALAAGVVMSRRARRRGESRWFTAARAAVMASALYIAAMIGLRVYGQHVVERALAAEGVHAERVMVAPIAASVLRREVLVDDGARYRFATLWLLPRPAFAWTGEEIPVRREEPAARAAAATADGQLFLRWSRFPYFVVRAAPDGSARVVIADARYTRGPGGGWAAVEVAVPAGASP